MNDKEERAILKQLALAWKPELDKLGIPTYLAETGFPMLHINTNGQPHAGRTATLLFTKTELCVNRRTNHAYANNIHNRVWIDINNPTCFEQAWNMVINHLLNDGGR